MTFTSMELAVLAESGLAALKEKNGLFTKFARNFQPKETAMGTSILVPYMAAESASLWTTSTGYGPDSSTVTGLSITFTEPVKRTNELTPLQTKAYDFSYVANVILPNQIAAVTTECYKRIFALVDATTLPTQVSSSVATYDMVQSGSGYVFTSGSSATPIVLVGQKFDAQLKSNMASANYLVGANVINGNARSEYACGAADVVPAYTLPANATNADAAVLIPDSILCANAVPFVNEGSQVVDITDPTSGFTVRTFVWQHAINHTPQITTTCFFNVQRGRPGFGARLKVN